MIQLCDSHNLRIIFVVGHICKSIILIIFVNHYCKSFLQIIFVKHFLNFFCGTFLMVFFCLIYHFFCENHFCSVIFSFHFQIPIFASNVKNYCQAWVLVLVQSWSSPGLIIVKIGSMSNIKKHIHVNLKIFHY